MVPPGYTTRLAMGRRSWEPTYSQMVAIAETIFIIESDLFLGLHIRKTHDAVYDY